MTARILATTLATTAVVALAVTGPAVPAVASAAPPGVTKTATAADESLSQRKSRLQSAAPQPASQSYSAATAPAYPATAHRQPHRATLVDPRARHSAAASLAACTTADFTGRTGSALAQFIRTSTVSCVNTLYSLTGSDAYGAFREAQMAAVAYGLRDQVTNYPGNNSTGVAQLVAYLRAGYYVHWYHETVVGTYGPALQTAIRSGLDTFFNHPRSQDVNDANGEILAEAVILVDSAEENARYLHVVRRLLNGYSTGYDPYWYMVNAVNNVYTILFRGHQVPAFVTAVQADRSTLDTLHSFAIRNLGLLGGENSFLASNAGRELGRFLRHTAIAATVRPLTRDLLTRSAITGPTAPLWVGVAEMTAEYDVANCAYYQTCDLAARLAAAVLPITHTCSASLRLRAQQMTATELGSACTSLRHQDAYFHGVAKDPGPVAGDNNTTLEVVAFDSSTDYQTYAGAMFGIDTNNGGMYLEGNPAAAGNQPRFIAYEAEWLRPAFEIWNLNHEYTHYLDGRFNMHGDFTAGVSTPTIWWIEGFAEYISYHYRNLTYTAAIAEAGKQTYQLRTLFDTTYSHDSTRVYRWGYLAVRYMIQSHPADVATILGHYRAGNWAAARTFLTSTIGARYNADWSAWLTRCAAGDCGSATPPGLPECTGADVRVLGRNCQRSNISVSAGNYHYMYLYLPTGVSQLRITASGGTGNCDLYYHASTWATTTAYTQRSTNPGNAETLTVAAPAAGYRYLTLHGAAACAGVVVKTEY